MLRWEMELSVNFQPRVQDGLGGKWCAILKYFWAFWWQAGYRLPSTSDPGRVTKGTVVGIRRGLKSFNVTGQVNLSRCGWTVNKSIAARINCVLQSALSVISKIFNLAFQILCSFTFSQLCWSTIYKQKKLHMLNARDTLSTITAINMPITARSFPVFPLFLMGQ